MKTRGLATLQLLKPKFFKTLAALIGVAVLSLLVLVILRPWSLEALSEGKPASVWPGEGNFATQGDNTAVAPSFENELEPTAEFLHRFAESEGSAFVVIRDGEVVTSHYAEGFDEQTQFNSYSMSKSLVGLLALKAVSDGRIETLDQTVAEFWPETKDLAVGDITIQTLMDMSSGITFETDPTVESDGAASGKKDTALTYGPFSNSARLHVEGLDAVIGDVEVDPDAVGNFSYQNISTAIMGRVLENLYQSPLDNIVQEQLAEPAGATGFRWRRYSNDSNISPYCCIYATTDWWAKVSVYVLNNGSKDSPFLTDDWHEYLTGTDINNADRGGAKYRSQIRYDILDRDGEELQGPFLLFTGLDGQMIYFVPGHNLIVIRFGKKYQLIHTTLYDVSKFE